jgi:hypothetical protein
MKISFSKNKVRKINLSAWQSMPAWYKIYVLFQPMFNFNLSYKS